jgi:hypothetical protein
MAKYLFNSHIYSSEDDNWQRVLHKAYATKIRPICLCLPQELAIQMYISVAQGQHMIKRMPNTGPLHAPYCSHYEPPPELSGLGQVNGSAIREELESESTTLSLDFPLSKGRSRPLGASGEIEHESVRSDGTKLTMRGLLHYLFDEAGLTRWTPAMDGKRTWFVVRRELMAAAVSKKTKGQHLPDLLYLPESFNLEREQEIKARQLASLTPLSTGPSARMIVVGEIKQLDSARFGQALVIKHMPDLKLMVPDDMAKHLTKRFASQLQLWAQLANTHLLVLGTISRSSQGVYSLESACLMNVNEQWIPFESAFEWELLNTLHVQARRFVKGLRYNLPTSKPLASVVIQDTGDASTAMFLVQHEHESDYAAAIDELVQRTALRAWVWHTGSEALPALPGRKLGRHERP